MCPGGDVGLETLRRLPAAEAPAPVTPSPPAPAGRVLVVDDEPQALRALRATLMASGYHVATATTGAEAVDAVILRPPAAVLLDVLLPDEDGVGVCRRLREWTQVPVIMVSAVEDEGTMIAALDAGADDYVTKPFSPPELLARLRTAIRRSASGGGDPVITAGDLTLDLGRREVRRGGSLVHLTPREYELLATLARHPGRVLAHAALLHALWGVASERQSHSLHVHMSSLRRKLEPDPGRPRHLVTETGVGYRLRGDS